jgi:hypothetical protein
MTPWTIDRLGGTALTSVIELFLLWKIWKSLRRGSVSVTFGDKMPGESYLYLAAERETLPVYYWLLVALLVLFAIAVGGAIGLIAGGFIS